MIAERQELVLCEKGVMRRMHDKKKQVIIFAMMIMVLVNVIMYNPVNVEAADYTEKSVIAKIPVSCAKIDSEETFEYQLKGEPSEFEKIETTELKLKSGEKGYFQISYCYPGNYHYIISQKAGADKKTTYDTAEYQVDVCVTEDKDGKLFAQPILYQEGSEEKKAELKFYNIIKKENQNKTNPTNIRKNVKTGDTTDISLWSVVLILSGTFILILGFKKCKKRREE